MDGPVSDWWQWLSDLFQHHVAVTPDWKMSGAPDEDNLVLFTTLEILSDHLHNTYHAPYLSEWLVVLFLWLCLLSTQFIASSDARVLGARRDPQQDKVLGAGHGRVAPPAHCSTAEMDTDGNQPGCNEREWPGHAHPQHAHQDDRVLPQQVSFGLTSTFTMVYRDVGWTFLVNSRSKITVCRFSKDVFAKYSYIAFLLCSP